MVATVKILPCARVASVTQSVPFGGKDHSSSSSSALAASQRAIWRARGETDGRTDAV